MENLVSEVFNDLNNDIEKMARYIVLNHTGALNALHDQDKKQALEVIEYDERINQLEENINNKVVIAIARYQPVAGDLRRLIGIMKLANDLERIGDYAKSIAKVIVTEQLDFILDDIKKTILDKVHEAFIGLFEEAIQAYKDGDADKAYEIAKADDVIDIYIRKAISLSNKIDLDPPVVQSYISFMHILRKLERAKDHTKNICEAIIYIDNGTRIDF